MASYEGVRIQSEKIYQTPTRREWDLWLELKDHEKESVRKEFLLIQTHISEPLQDHPQAKALKALQHVRDLLTEQIERMQSR